MQIKCVKKLGTGGQVYRRVVKGVLSEQKMPSRRFGLEREIWHILSGIFDKMCQILGGEIALRCTGHEMCAEGWKGTWQRKYES